MNRKGGLIIMAVVAVRAYAEYKEGKWTGTVYNFMTFYESKKMEEEKGIKLVNMVTHEKRQFTNLRKWKRRKELN